MTVYTVIGNITNAILTFEPLPIPSNLSGGPHLFVSIFGSKNDETTLDFIIRWHDKDAFLQELTKEELASSHRIQASPVINKLNRRRCSPRLRIGNDG